MKGALLTAAVLLGSAQADVHKLKLKKVPLAEQLVSITPTASADDADADANRSGRSRSRSTLR